jgi:hypothetical protein
MPPIDSGRLSVSEEALKRTEGIFCESPDLSNELLEAAATGNLDILKHLNISARKSQHTSPRRKFACN